jgi:epoxyqueuosine reductase
MEPKCRLVAIELLPRTTSKFGYFKISKYAYGADYHFVLGKVERIFVFYSVHQGSFRTCFCRFSSSTDKAWAAKSGLGWIGKNSNLLTQKVVLLFYRRTYYRLRFRL